MDRDEKWAVIAEGRRELADLLAGLSEHEWERPSLCAQWRVRDVAAHVALTPQSPGMLRIVAAGMRAGGDLQAVNRDLALAHARHPTTRLVAELRELADSRARPAITTLDNLLFDVLVHVQDVALPLGRTVPMPLAGAREGLDRVWRMGWPFWARRRFRGTRFVATHAGWTAGDAAGAEVRGPAAALLLLLTGRHAAALPRLAGDGLAHLAEPA
ncbi:maleylpyruvate isomerase family mycothiol-dependent enzyme [Pseudonocardia sp. RS11V-5]|uniref:maleylpyruvate isomerase family mycothiol-dependent enzyme n=1 Tax=Pseudonocardia terrae TaxID=2905831 RepID=UPI001E43144C|nr:maleylpyruvate isomerase family mycothiol-dependent enzyme [Pseudonocardia terrae]MCE3549854.1 maleylpyruvate isomerase family mycothiol-dependent enzyme [Pseudonocardia terrae]